MIPFPPDHYLTEEKAQEWSLVLSSRGISHTVVKTPDGWSIAIAQDDEEKVRAEILGYENENVSTSAVYKDLPYKIKPYELLVPFVVLIIFHFLVVLTDSPFEWYKLGRASNVIILEQGQWWRLFTALTLHSDSIHLFSNVVFGAVIASSLLQQVGTGLGWFLITVSGGGGNLLNAFFRDNVYASIGASTAVFGSLGIVTGLQILESQKISWRRMGILIASAFALLGFLGTGGERTDVGAHFFGFFMGLPLGVITSVIIHRQSGPDKKGQYLFGVTAGMIVIFSWLCAFYCR